METYRYAAGYPDSGDSPPRPRDIDCENVSWEDHHPQPCSPTNYRVKFMCSYGGKIIPRPHDNQLSYVGGHTKILTVDRTISLPSFLSRLSSLLSSPSPSSSSPDLLLLDATDFCFKYQLPGEDLDALISVTNDEDLDLMMLEYDHLLLRSSPKPARLRLFLFPISPPPADTRTDRQWFLDALNSAPTDVPPAQTVAVKPAAKALDPTPEEVSVPRPEPGKEERQQIGGESVVPAVEIHRQIQELQRLQIEQQHPIFQQRRADEAAIPRVFTGDYHPQKPQEKVTSPTPAVTPAAMPVQQNYWPDRQIPVAPTSGFQLAAATSADSPVYLIPAPVYRSPASTGQSYYVPRVVPEVHRETSTVYGVGPPPPAQKVAQYGDGVVLPQAVGVAYDSPGREVYYNAPGGVVSSYQTVAAPGVEVRQVPAATLVALTQEGKVLKPAQSS